MFIECLLSVAIEFCTRPKCQSSHLISTLYYMRLDAILTLKVVVTVENRKILKGKNKKNSLAIQLFRDNILEKLILFPFPPRFIWAPGVFFCGVFMYILYDKIRILMYVVLKCAFYYFNHV